MMRHLIIPELAADMQRVEEKLSEKLAPVSWDPAVCRILEEVRLAEGKMIRPQVLLLCGMCGSRYRENSDRICLLAALVEMVHMASLIHDDIVDDSPFRRGRPTVQSAFGKDMAVYAGDLLLSRVMQVLFEEELVKEGRLFSSLRSVCFIMKRSSSNRTSPSVSSLFLPASIASVIHSM